MDAIRVALRWILACCLITLALATPVQARTAGQPYAGDRLAYVSHGQLYVGLPEARLVPGPGNAFEPVFSHDGRWLAFLRQEWQGEFTSTAHLWLARADGSDAHEVTSIGSATVDSFAWSPSRDVLAVQPVSATGGFLPVQLIPAQGRARAVPEKLGGFDLNLLWVSGKTLAIEVFERPPHSQLDLITGSRVQSYTVPGIGTDDPLKLAAWWPAAHSIVYWLDGGGCFSCIADGTPLYAFNLQTGRTHRLGTGLIYRDWVAISGAHLLAVTGGPRMAFFGKHLEVCNLKFLCATIAGIPPGDISLDPAWSPDGRQMAFVVAPAWNVSGFMSGARYRRWLSAHVLWIARSDGTQAGPVTSGIGTGVQDPQWTGDGRGMVFVKDGALWVDSHLGAANAQPVARLVPTNDVPALSDHAFQNWYYGHMNWHDLFAWYQGIS